MFHHILPRDKLLFLEKPVVKHFKFDAHRRCKICECPAAEILGLPELLLLKYAHTNELQCSIGFRKPQCIFNLHFERVQMDSYKRTVLN